MWKQNDRRVRGEQVGVIVLSLVLIAGGVLMAINTDFLVADLTRIALGCVYIQTGRALTDFPTTTRGHPSEWVVISRSTKPPLIEGSDKWFPFQVPWDVWQGVVVPLLRAGGDGDNLWVQYRKSGTTDWIALVRSWAALLRSRVDPTLTEEDVSEEELLGEPILRGPLALTGDDLIYPQVDSQLAWADGSPRLTYPEVDQ